MDTYLVFIFLGLVIDILAFSTPVKKGNNWKPQRRNSKMMEGFSDPKRPLTVFEKLDQFLHRNSNETVDEKINEIPDDLEPKIVNGREAREREFPWMVALHYQGRFICSASLITTDLVLTAAHCVELDDNGAEPASSFYGIVGNIRREGPETRIDFSEVVTHPNYAQSQGETGDIALFRVRNPVAVTDFIRPICLTSAGRNFEKQEVTAMGWGVTSTSDKSAHWNEPPASREPPETLMTTQLRVQERIFCQIFFAFFGIRITERHICANSREATGVCFGDSGGPLVYQDPSGVPIEIGVAAFITAFGCGRPYLPNVYTAVAEYNDWIIQQVGNNSGVCFV